MRYAITGASGQLGGLVAQRLLELVDPTDVVLLTRSPDGLTEFAGRGADVRAIDFGDTASLGPAFAGVDRLLLISSDTIGTRLDGQRAAIAAAALAGVQHVLYTSVPEPVPDNPALVVPDHAGTEQALRDSGMTWTFLRNNLYADMQLGGIAQAASSGQLVSNSGEGRAAYVTRADCAAVAAGALAGDAQENGAYDITGPQALSNADLAALASESAGRDVAVVHVDDDAFAAGLRSAGLPAEAVDVIVSFGAAIRGGYLATVSSAVADLAGKAPTPLAALA